MLSEIDIKDVVYSLLINLGVESIVSGKVYKEQREQNSMLEDVEISVLASTVSQNQEFTVNVNVFVPDVKRDNEMIENTPRLRSLCTSFLSMLEYHSFDGYLMTLESQRVMKVNDTDLHLINNRLDIKYNSEN